MEQLEIFCDVCIKSITRKCHYKLVKSDIHLIKSDDKPKCQILKQVFEKNKSSSNQYTFRKILLGSLRYYKRMGKS